MAFNKELFLKKNQDNREAHPFEEVDLGGYICDLVDSKACYSKGKGLYQAQFQWKIDPDANDRFKGQNIFVCIGLENDDKTQKDKGYEILDIVLNTLGVKDRAEFVQEFEENMPKLNGTRARMLVYKDLKGYKKHKVDRLIKNAWNENRGVITPNHAAPSSPQQGISNAPAYDNKPFTNTHGVEIKQDQKVTVRRPDGQALGKILSVVPNLQQALIQFENPDIQTQLYAYEDLWAWETPKTETVSAPQVETIEEISTTPAPVKLEVGMNVTGTFNDGAGNLSTITGTVHRIDEEKQIVLIASGGKGYPCSASTVKLIQ